MPTESDATALELVQKLIVDNTTPAPVPGTSIFMAYHASTADDPDVVYQVLYGPDREPEFTAGTVVAIEHTRVDVLIQGPSLNYAALRKEAARIRYLVGGQGEYVALGLRMIHAQIEGGVEDLGMDALERQQFLVKFDISTDPNYA